MMSEEDYKQWRRCRTPAGRPGGRRDLQRAPRADSWGASSDAALLACRDAAALEVGGGTGAPIPKARAGGASAAAPLPSPQHPAPRCRPRPRPPPTPERLQDLRQANEALAAELSKLHAAAANEREEAAGAVQRLELEVATQRGKMVSPRARDRTHE
jgi:hypothetical protein